MRRLVVAEFMTLDGVMEAPGFEEHCDGRNAWALRLQSEETQQFIRDHYATADALLLGRTMYQIWAAFWPTAQLDDAFTKQMNDLPKYVVSSTLKEVAWNNSHLLQGGPAFRVLGPAMRADHQPGSHTSSSARVADWSMERETRIKPAISLHYFATSRTNASTSTREWPGVRRFTILRVCAPFPFQCFA